MRALKPAEAARAQLLSVLEVNNVLGSDVDMVQSVARKRISLCHAPNLRNTGEVNNHVHRHLSSEGQAKVKKSHAKVKRRSTRKGQLVVP